MKLKQLLEGYAWERKADGSLPTLADATSKHEQNIKEQTRSIDRGVDSKLETQIKTAVQRVKDAYTDATKGMDGDTKFKVAKELRKFKF